tara:strand:+ start:462 stop:767 length:306 start_codon:yes stop_codon:yes gene_type:complete
MSKRKIIDLNLNLTKLGEAKEFYTQGKKGLYVDIRLIEMDNKEYNDMMCVVKIPKDQYDQGVKGEIVGYAKDWSMHNSESNGASSRNDAPGEKLSSEDLPF